MIVAAGPLPYGGIVHAVVVIQPVTWWTVRRTFDDFKALNDSLAQLLSHPPLFPAAQAFDGADVNIIVHSRNALQDWLDRVLMHPAARESPDMRNFLTYGANMTPPQFEGVSWITFSSLHTETEQSSDFDDMEDVDDSDNFVPASIRYKATHEPITDEDKMDLAAIAAEVEMVDDIGSLAQSLGASHLGQYFQHDNGYDPRPSDQNHVLGLQLKQPPPQPTGGGVGSLSKLMEMAQQQSKVQGLGDNIVQKRPVSAPTLDSFELVKVIGKGSFGKLVARLSCISFALCLNAAS